MAEVRRASPEESFEYLHAWISVVAMRMGRPRWSIFLLDQPGDDLNLATMGARPRMGDPMPRRIRLFVAGGVYHVYGRVTRGEPIFEEPTEVEGWIDAVAYEARLAEMEILAWCLMSGHFHLVVQTGVTPLWKVMHRIPDLLTYPEREMSGPGAQSC